jgi:hypothetical protein
LGEAEGKLKEQERERKKKRIFILKSYESEVKAGVKLQFWGC